MNLLVLGGTGFIGAPLVRRLVEKNHAVAVLHRGRTAADLPAGVALLRGDVYRNYDGLRGVSDHEPDPAPLAEEAPLRETLFPYEALDFTPPVALEDALQRTVRWQRQHPPPYAPPPDYAAEDAALDRPEGLS